MKEEEQHQSENISFRIIDTKKHSHHAKKTKKQKNNTKSKSYIINHAIKSKISPFLSPYTHFYPKNIYLLNPILKTRSNRLILSFNKNKKTKSKKNKNRKEKKFEKNLKKLKI